LEYLALRKRREFGGGGRLHLKFHVLLNSNLHVEGSQMNGCLVRVENSDNVGGEITRVSLQLEANANESILIGIVELG
jgi:hypothetical protein